MIQPYGCMCTSPLPTSIACSAPGLRRSTRHGSPNPSTRPTSRIGLPPSRLAENRWLGCPICRIVTAIEASDSIMSGDRWDRSRASSVVPGRRSLLGRCGHGPYESRLHRPRDGVPQRGRAGDRDGGHVGDALGSKPPDGRWLPGHRRCRRATPAAREWQGGTGAAGVSAIRRGVERVPAHGCRRRSARPPS
jgi:hypothetical protein